MSPVSLPPELVLSIISHVTDTPILQTCALVSKYWCSMTSPRLFHTIHVDGIASRKSFSALLSPDATFLHHVKTLSLSPGYPEDQQVDKYFIILTRLEHITTLGLYVFQLPENCSQYQLSFSRITALELGAEFDTSTTCINFLGYFTSLEALSLGVRIGSSRTDGPYSGHTRVPSKLKRFELSSSPTQNYQYILEWLLTADISLETIGLYLYWNHEQEALLSSLLNAHSQTLTTLKLDLTSCSPDSRLPVSFFNLGQKPSLQCLELTGIHTEWDISRGMGFLQDLLCSFSHQSLIQRISLSFARQMDIITALKDVDWVRFAHALEGPAFTDLKTLHIQYSGALRSNEAQSFRNIVTSGLLWLEKGGALIF